ncbi:MAG: MFS transporter [Candidatus Gastranaerophilaceae bacterium]
MFPTAGHFISIYAIGVIFGAVSMAFLSKNQPLKKLLAGLIIVYTLGNILTAFALNYEMMNVARFITGIPHGSFFGIGVVAIKQMAEKGHEGRDTAFMVAEMTIANLAGIPLATYLCQIFSWRIIYLFVGILGLIILTAIIKWLPFCEPMPYTNFKGQFKFLKSLTPWLLFIAITMGNSGLFCELSYINPLLVNVSGFAPQSISIMMLVSGLGMYFGNYFAGKLSDKYTPAKVSQYTQLTAAIALLLLFLFAQNQLMAVLLVFVCSFCLFALSAPQQILIV